MSNWLITVIFLPLMTFSSCISNPESVEEQSNLVLSYPYHVDLIEGLNNKVEYFNLSDIADSIRFVPLETSNECLIGGMNGIELDGDDIFIYAPSGQKSSYYFRFNTDGDFLNTIGSIGRGPAEYLHSSFSLDIEKEKVVIFRWYGGSKDFISFNYDGTYYGKCAYSRQPSDGVHIFEILSGSRLLIQDYGYFLKRGNRTDNTLSSDLKLYKLYDSTGYLINSIPHPITFQPLEDGKNYESGFTVNSDISFFNGSARLSAQDHDTSYMVSGDSILPAYIFHRGELNPDFEERYGSPKGKSDRKFLSSYIWLYETDEFMFRYYLLNSTDEAYRFRYNKLTGIVESQASSLGFKDDLSGGPNIHFYRPTNKGDNVWVSLVQAKEFKEKYAEGTQPLDEKNKQFYDNRIGLAEMINEDDNPIVIIVYLKKSE